MIRYLLVLSIIFLLFPCSVRAEYQLPYPSYMPGNKLYVVSRVVDSIKKFWNFGNIASTKYHMSLSDKYLVEAKVLFEYKQYLLAFNALDRSDYEFKQIYTNKRKIDSTVIKVQSLDTACQEQRLLHIQILSKLTNDLPKNFIWKPEKMNATALSIDERINTSIMLRRLYETN